MEHDHIKTVVARANLDVSGRTYRSEGGLPIGNGVMGTLVWTSPTALKMQVNRIDVFANDSYTNSFNERHSDYGYACGFIDIDFAGYSGDVFTGDTKQHLELYTAEGSIECGAVAGSFFSCEGLDAFVFNVRDGREDADGVNIRLRMLRPAESKVKSHLAVSSFKTVGDIMVLEQKFTEGDYYCASAVAVAVRGKESRIRYSNESGGLHQGIEGRDPIVLGMESETEMRMCLKPGPGSFDIYISSCASFDRDTDVAGEAARLAGQAADTGRECLKAEKEKYWADFWSRSYVELWGNDDAALVEIHYQYFMYIMGCCSRNGRYSPNFGGLLFSTRGDLRHWGTMQWWNNLMIYYNAVMASGRYELVMPYFQQWNNIYDRCAIAAKQNWDSSGIFIPETVGFDGPEILPDDIARELSDLMLVRKPWSEHSQRFWDFAVNKRPHESRWNFMSNEKWENGVLKKEDRGIGCFGPVTHMFGGQAGIAFLYWEYYRYSGDLEYLREYGYPMIKGVAEFFRTFPNVKLGEDGKYHVHYTSCDEGFFGSIDSMETMSAMYGIFPVAIRVSEILSCDEDLRALWNERLAALAPLPVQPDGSGGYIWAGAVTGLYEEHQRTGANVLPSRASDLCSLETEETNPELFEMGMRSLQWLLDRNSASSRRFVYEMSGYGRIFANMGQSEALGEMLVGQINCINAEKEYCYYKNNGCTPRFENRLTSREGINAMSAQRLGNAASAVQLALLQSSGGAPVNDPVIRLFPALPESWNARFALYAKGGFKVEASRSGGKIEQITVTSVLGNTLRMRNSWGGGTVTLNGIDKGYFDGKLLEMETNKGDILIIIIKG